MKKYQGWLSFVGIMTIGIAILLSLSVVALLFLTKSVNASHDKYEMEKMRDYCFEHADREAKGEHVVNDLVKAGLVNSTYYDYSCSKVNDYFTKKLPITELFAKYKAEHPEEFLKLNSSLQNRNK
jgi:hypothetical protein